MMNVFKWNFITKIKRKQELGHTSSNASKYSLKEYHYKRKNISRKSETHSSIEFFGNDGSATNNSSSDSPKETSHNRQRQKGYQHEYRGEFKNTRSLDGKIKIGVEVEA